MSVFQIRNPGWKTGPKLQLHLLVCGAAAVGNLTELLLKLMRRCSKAQSQADACVVICWLVTWGYLWFFCHVC